MKKLAILVLVVLMGTAFAQTFPTDQGSMLVAGGASYSSAKGDLYEDMDKKAETIISIMPSIGYFIVPGLAIGGTVEYTKDSQGDYSSSTLGIGPQVAFFIGGNVKPDPIKGKTSLFVTASYLFQNTTYKSPSVGLLLAKAAGTTDETKVKFNSLEFGGGVLHMLSDAVGLTAQVTYSMDSRKHDAEGAEAVKGNQLKVMVGIATFLY